MMNYGYAVVTINQASQHAEEVDGVFWSAAEAKGVRDSMHNSARDIGRRERFVICELVEVEKD